MAKLFLYELWTITANVTNKVIEEKKKKVASKHDKWINVLAKKPHEAHWEPQSHQAAEKILKHQQVYLLKALTVL